MLCAGGVAAAAAVLLLVLGVLAALKPGPTPRESGRVLKHRQWYTASSVLLGNMLSVPAAAELPLRLG